MKFKKEVLQELIDSGEFDGLKVIKDEVYDTSRWSILKQLVFSKEEKFYMVCYSVGATEYQDEGPFEWSPNEIECTEVFPFEEVVIVYRPF